MTGCLDTVMNVLDDRARFSGSAASTPDGPAPTQIYEAFYFRVRESVIRRRLDR